LFISGTTVTVSNLFKRYPVRRNYYSTSKRCQDELRRVDDCLVAFAVVRFTLRMTFRHNGTVVWTKAATSDVQHSLSAVVGSTAVAAMKHIQRDCLQPSVINVICRFIVVSSSYLSLFLNSFILLYMCKDYVFILCGFRYNK